MITEGYLYDEIELATSIFLYYTEKMIDYLKVNSSKYKLWYKDSLQISYLLNLLKEVWFEEGTAYLGNSEISDRVLLLTFYKIREYWLNDINTNYVSGVNSDITVPDVQPPYYPFTPEWKSFIVEINSDVTKTIDLSTYGFDYTKIDLKSLIITGNQGLNPIEIVTNNLAEGCRIVGNTFYWNSGNYYDLNSGDQLYFKYLQIQK
jgi:hypothetical protein